MLKETARDLKKTLGLESYPVGVKFIWQDNEMPAEAIKLSGHRYCQALMKARRGEKVILDAQGIACPAAAAAFGFKPLPEGLKTGKGLIGFGITREEITGKTMFEGMDTLTQGKLKALFLYPLEQADVEPDVVVMEDETEKLMWVALAYLNVTGGQRVDSSTAILQATCVDATILPYNKQKLNLSYGCYGCRDATDIGGNETVLGFPFKFFEAIAEYVEYLAHKAIPNSRGKNALTLLKKKNAENVSKSDPFKSQ